MKSILLGVIIFFGSYTLNAQGWNSVVTTTIDVTGFTSADDFANKDGIHVLLAGSSSVKYVLLNSSGSVVRQTTLETVEGGFPNVAGDNSVVFVVYQKGSAIKAKKGVLTRARRGMPWMISLSATPTVAGWML